MMNFLKQQLLVATNTKNIIITFILDVISHFGFKGIRCRLSITLQFNAVYSYLGCQKRKYFKTEQK